ncbi:MAG: tyrosine-type recombinase/integrase [Victivallales bacterium]|nr:tyrosine-type recombinase/integrase [Victivallales bacterium]
MKKKNEKINERTPYGTLYQNEPSGWFYFRYQANGRRHNEGLGTKDYDAAKKIVSAKYAERVQKDRLGLNAPEAIRLSLGDAWKKYSESPDRALPATVSEAQSYEKTWGEFVEFMGNPKIKLQDITYEDANRFANELRGRHLAVDTHNRKIKRLKKIFRVLQKHWTGTNPFDSQTLLRKMREENDLGVRRLGFTVEQEQKILEALEDPKKKVINKPEIRVIFYLGIYTGQRLKDCVLLRWNNIDLVQKRLEVRQNKTGKFVSLPIAPQLETVLREAKAWQESPDGYVCPKVAERYGKKDANGKNTGLNLVNIDVMRVIKWAGIEPSVKTPDRDKSICVYGFHSLRHAFASHCAELGVPLAVVQSILGDESKILAKYYTHIGGEAQRDAIDKLAGTIGVLSAEDRINRALEFIESREEKTTDLLKIEEILTTRDHVVEY